MPLEVQLSDISILHSKATKEQKQLEDFLNWLNSLSVKIVDIPTTKIQIPEEHREFAARFLQAPMNEVKEQGQTSSISKLKANFSPEQVENALKKAFLEVQQYTGERYSSHPQKGYKTLQSFFQDLGLTLKSDYPEMSRNRCTNHKYAVVDSHLPDGYTHYFPNLENSEVNNLLDIAMKDDSGTNLKDALLSQTFGNYFKSYSDKKKKSEKEIKQLLANVDLVEVFLNGLRDFKEEIIYHRLKDLHNKLLGKMTADEKSAIKADPENKDTYTKTFGPVLERNKKLIQESAKRFAYLLAL